MRGKACACSEVIVAALVRGWGSLTALRQLQERAERVVDAIQGVLGPEPLASSDPREVRPLDRDGAEELVESVEERQAGGHRWFGSRGRRILRL